VHRPRWTTPLPPIHPFPVSLTRRKIRLIESNDKCRYLKKLTCKWTLRQVLYQYEVLSPPMTLYSPTVYVYTVYLFTHGRGGGVLTKEKVRGAIAHKTGQKYQHD
jgi:hypothetical protein